MVTNKKRYVFAWLSFLGLFHAVLLLYSCLFPNILLGDMLDIDYDVFYQPNIYPLHHHLDFCTHTDDVVGWNAAV